MGYFVLTIIHAAWDRAKLTLGKGEVHFDGLDVSLGNGQVLVHCYTFLL